MEIIQIIFNITDYLNYIRNLKDKKILPDEVTRMALKGTTAGKVNETENIEQSELNLKNIKKGD